MSAPARSLFIVAAKRTPFGAFGGALKDHTATDLAAIAAKATIAAAKISPTIVDTVIFGNVAQTSSDAAYLARHVGLRAETGIATPALTVNRLCGSGFQALVSGAHEILSGEATVALVGGTESMSQAPFAARGIRFGVNLGTNPPFEDTLFSALTDSHIKTPMAITAENLAEQYQISREDVDKFALASQTRWAAAQAAGRFNSELTPVEYKSKKGPASLTHDEHPRPQTTLEILAKLKPVFKKDGVVTAGNASGIADGAAALILVSEEAVKKHGLTPLARVVSWASVGVSPSIMGIGPVPAIQSALARAKLQVKDIDIFDINEAFAAQFLSVQKALNLDPAKTNVCGGAIALGHPLGASGARILAHLTHQLKEQNKKYAVGSACIGGGQGIAVVLERA